MYFFLLEYGFDWYVYVYGVEIITKFWWESGFLKGRAMALCTEVQGTLCSFKC